MLYLFSVLHLAFISLQSLPLLIPSFSSSPENPFLFVSSHLRSLLVFLPRRYMDKRQMFLVKEGVDALCEETRTIAVPAVDAFG